MTKQLTLEQVQALKVGDWIWIIDNEIPINTGYYKVEAKIKSHIRLSQGQLALLPFACYGKEWLAYKNNVVSNKIVEDAKHEMACKIFKDMLNAVRSAESGEIITVTADDVRNIAKRYGVRV